MCLFVFFLERESLSLPVGMGLDYIELYATCSLLPIRFNGFFSRTCTQNSIVLCKRLIEITLFDFHYTTTTTRILVAYSPMYNHGLGVLGHLLTLKAELHELGMRHLLEKRRIELGHPPF